MRQWGIEVVGASINKLLEHQEEEEPSAPEPFIEHNTAEWTGDHFTIIADAESRQYQRSYDPE